MPDDCVRMTLKSIFVRQMFDRVATRYDRFNTIISLGLDRLFRARAVRAVRDRSLVLDACGGSGEMTRILFRSGFSGRVVLLDFSRSMTGVAKSRLDGSPVHLVVGDAQRIPFRDDAFDGAVQGFGLRNLSDRPRFFGQLGRVLSHGGRAVLLDMSGPPGLWGRVYGLYFYRLAPVIVRLLGGDADAYGYLPTSVREFPDPTVIAGEAETATGGRVEIRRTLGGVVVEYVVELDESFRNHANANTLELT
jgi:demethylmenaquinone methyltransferase/2-methoxy-6-polyprenyl-1,4-benzoquinol methylase